MDKINTHFELVASRVFDNKTKTATLKDEQINALTALVSDSLIRGRAFVNMDAGRDLSSAPAGVMTLHKPKEPVNPELISDSLFQYLAVAPIIHPEDLGYEYDDAYFQNEKTFARLNEAVPQFGGNAFSIVKHRSRRDNRDINAWEAELGQDNACAGIYKMVHENGIDTEYCVLVRAGSPFACNELKAMVAKRADGPNPMTWEEFDRCDETSAVRANAQNNALRLAYNVALACAVNIPRIQDGEAHTKNGSQPWRSTADPQRVSSVEEIYHQSIPNGGRAIAVFNEVTSSNRVCDTHHVMGSCADNVLQFCTVGLNPRDVALPCTTGRKTALPQNGQVIADQVNADDKLKRRHAKLSKRFIWEGKDEVPFHPDIQPESHYTANPRRDRAFVDAMASLGWDHKRGFNVMYPVAVKLSNPFLKRPAHGSKDPNTSAKDVKQVMSAYDQ